jgi:ComF family protein
LKNNLYRLTWDLIDVLFPPACGGCKQAGVRWCQTCQQETQIVCPPLCEICGQSIQTNRICSRCLQHEPQIKAIRSWADFQGPVRKALQDLKYRRNIGLGITLSNFLVELVRQYPWKVDLLSPVPLGRNRQKERGYNQADLLAKPLAFNLQLPYNPRILVRKRETQSQVELSLAERRTNLKDAFQADPKKVKGKNIMVVDDVTTSGSTLEACAIALLEAGAKTVYGVTVARAILSARVT